VRPRVAAFDGLRCLAFLCVFYHHSVAPGGIWGGLGVSAFFALSGFLITGGLMRDARPARAALRSFYLRRSLRIFPLYYLTLIALLLTGLLPFAAWYFGYASNVLLYRLRAYDGPRTHFWTLAVEEQFYLVFPLLFFIVRRHRVLFMAALIAGCEIARYTLDDGSGWSDSLLPVCGEYLLWGALAAMLLAARPGQTIDGRWLVVTGVVIVTVVYLPHSPLPTGTPDAMGFALIVTGLWTAERAFVSRVLALAPFAYLGRVSYGLYVFHNLVIGAPFQWLRAGLRDIHWVRTEPWILNLAVTVLLASVSWHLVELPILRLKSRIEARFQPSRSPPVETLAS